jgi:hypothetical protein
MQQQGTGRIDRLLGAFVDLVRHNRAARPWGIVQHPKILLALNAKDIDSILTR